LPACHANKLSLLCNFSTYRYRIKKKREGFMAAAIQSPHTDILLQNLQYQGTSNDCGPYTTATVINALRGAHLTGDELAQQMNKPRWRGILPVIRRVPNWATFPWGMSDVFKDYGLQARWWFRVPVSYLRPAIAGGHLLMPISGEWRPKPWAHVMTLVAWDPEKGWGFANTQYSHHHISWQPDLDFQARWDHYGHLLVEIINPI
jgi:hypothetical protein